MVACQAPLSVGFSRQEYWSGLPCPPPGDLPDPGIKPMSLLSPELAGGFFITVPPGKPILKEKLNLKIKKINWEFEMDWDFGISRSIICRLDK